MGIVFFLLRKPSVGLRSFQLPDATPHQPKMTMTTTISIDLSNNESLARGITCNSDGTFTAVTFSASKTFKTRAGAVRWLSARIAN